MEGIANHVVYNPPSLKLLCVCRVRQSVSCVGQNVESNLLEKLTAGDFDDLRNPNVPISLEDMCKYFYESTTFHPQHDLQFPPTPPSPPPPIPSPPSRQFPSDI